MSWETWKDDDFREALSIHAEAYDRDDLETTQIADEQIRAYLNKNPDAVSIVNDFTAELGKRAGVQDFKLQAGPPGYLGDKPPASPEAEAAATEPEPEMAEPGSFGLKALREGAQNVPDDMRSASGDPSIYEPPEVIPQGPVDMFGAFRNMLPMGLGGNHEHWDEPPQSWFRYENPDFAQVDASDPAFQQEYARWSDLKWKDAVAIARSENRPITRTKYVQPKTIEGKVVNKLMQVGDEGKAALIGAADQATAGVAPELLGKLVGDDESSGMPKEVYYRGVQERHPTGDMIGRGLAALTPFGAEQALASGFVKALPAANAGVRALVAGTGAAGGAAISTLGQNRVENISDTVEGRISPHTLDEALDDATTDALVAKGLGFTGHLAAEGLGGLRAGRRSSTGPNKDLAYVMREADKAGIESRLFGPKVPKHLDDIVREADAVNRTPEEVAGERVAPGIKQEGYAHAKRARQAVPFKAAEAYRGSPEGKRGQRVNDLAQEVFSLLKRARIKSVGKDIATEEGTIRTLRKMVPNIFEVRELPEQAVAQGSRSAGDVAVAKGDDLSKSVADSPHAKRQGDGSGEQDVKPGVRTGAESPMAGKKAPVEIPARGGTVDDPLQSDPDDLAISAENVSLSDLEPDLRKRIKDDRYRDAVVGAQGKARELLGPPPQGAEPEFTPISEEEMEILGIKGKPGIRYGIRPAVQTAEELNDFTRGLRKQFEVDSPGGDPGDVLERVEAAALRVRDKFPPNRHAPASLKRVVDSQEGKPQTISGYSARNTEESEAIAALERDMDAVGLPSKMKAEPQTPDALGRHKRFQPRLDTDQDRRVQKIITEYRNPNTGSKRRDELMEQWADLSGHRKQLDNLQGVKAAQAIRQYRSGSPVRVYGGGFGTGLGGVSLERAGVATDALQKALAQDMPDILEFIQSLRQGKGVVGAARPLALGGGALGVRASAITRGDEDRPLTEEDMQNLSRLLAVVQSRKQAQNEVSP